jgi:uncharacterized membrane protein
MGFAEIHPLVIHFPIALLSVGFLCDVLGFVFQKKSLEHAGWWNLFFGMFSSICAFITGLIADFGGSPRLIDEPFPLYENHAYLQILVICVLLILVLWRIKLGRSIPLGSRRALAYLCVFGVTVGVLFYGSHLGAVLSGRI